MVITFDLSTARTKSANWFCSSIGATGIFIDLNLSIETLYMDPLVPVEAAENSFLIDLLLNTYFI